MTPPLSWPLEVGMRADWGIEVTGTVGQRACGSSVSGAGLPATVTLPAGSDEPLASCGLGIGRCNMASVHRAGRHT